MTKKRLITNWKLIVIIVFVVVVFMSMFWIFVDRSKTDKSSSVEENAVIKVPKKDKEVTLHLSGKDQFAWTLVSQETIDGRLIEKYKADTREDVLPEDKQTVAFGAKRSNGFYVFTMLVEKVGGDQYVVGGEWSLDNEKNLITIKTRKDEEFQYKILELSRNELVIEILEQDLSKYKTTK